MSRAWQDILYAVQDRVATITLNRPDRLNAYTQTMGEELRAAFAAADADKAVRAIVLTGAGRGFCAGADMARLSAAVAGKSTLKVPGQAASEGLAANFAQRNSYILGIQKPIIAGINGAVAGIGLVLTLYCDIRYMAAGSKLTTAFARRGLIAEHGIAWMLPRLIGPMHALDLLLSARVIAAEEAAAMGLVRLLPAQDFAETVQARAAEIANLSSPRSVAIIKRQVYEGLFQSLAEATAIANREQEVCRDTEDFREGVAHFLEKRPPNFSGR
jgi:enoyl-CoA hydratase/carnithine racemase